MLCIGEGQVTIVTIVRTFANIVVHYNIREGQVTIVTIVRTAAGRNRHLLEGKLCPLPLSIALWYLVYTMVLEDVPLSIALTNSLAVQTISLLDHE